MKIKRFVASEMREALRQVRQQMGPDAVILSTKKIDEGIELTAAMDFELDELQVQPDSRIPNPEKAISSDRDETIIPSSFSQEYKVHGESFRDRDADFKADQSSQHAIDQLRDELAIMRELLENQLSVLAWKDFSQSRPQSAQLIHQLGRLGLNGEFATLIAEETAPSQDFREEWQYALRNLAGRIQIPDEEIIVKGGAYALLGPTGVGKTTTVAKLAVRHVMRFGRESIALISADGYRVGGHAQLASLGQLLGVPVYQANNESELQKLLRALNEKKLVLVDTPGLSPRDDRFLQQLKAYSDIEELQFQLLLAANMAEDVLAETVKQFSTLHLGGYIVTKLDEARSLGGILSVLLMTDASVQWSYLGVGQRLAEDLITVDAQWMVTEAIRLAKRHPMTSRDGKAYAVPEWFRKGTAKHFEFG